MRCPHCGHDTVIAASDYVPADHDCLHCGRQLSREEVEGERADGPRRARS